VSGVSQTSQEIVSGIKRFWGGIAYELKTFLYFSTKESGAPPRRKKADPDPDFLKKLLKKKKGRGCDRGWK